LPSPPRTDGGCIRPGFYSLLSRVRDSISCREHVLPRSCSCAVITPVEQTVYANQRQSRHFVSSKELNLACCAVCRLTHQDLTSAQPPGEEGAQGEEGAHCLCKFRKDPLQSYAGQRRRELCGSIQVGTAHITILQGMLAWACGHVLQKAVLLQAAHSHVASEHCAASKKEAGSLLLLKCPPFFAIVYFIFHPNQDQVA